MEDPGEAHGNTLAAISPTPNQTLQATPADRWSRQATLPFLLECLDYWNRDALSQIDYIYNALPDISHMMCSLPDIICVDMMCDMRDGYLIERYLHLASAGYWDVFGT